MDILLQDIRYAARKLIRTPGFTVIAVITLSLAIGATTAVFSIVNGVLLKSLPFRNPSEVVAVGSRGREREVDAMSAPDFVDYRDQTHSFTGMAAINTGNGNLVVAGATPVRLSLAAVGAPFFELLGVDMEYGRGFSAGEDKKGADKIVVLSDRFWRSHFGGDPRTVGRPISIDGKVYTVVGIAPPSMTYPQKRDAWLPLAFEDWMIDPENRGAHFLSGIGRVKPGVSVDAAHREMAALGERLRVQYPKSNASFGATAVSLRDQLVGDVRPILVTMLGAVAFVLLIACANVANLMLVRSSSRETEIAVRIALGAGTKRIVRQLITESVLLSALAATVGIAIAAWAVDAVVAFGPRGVPRLDEVTMDGRVLLFATGVSLLTGVLFGLVPAFHAARPEIGQMLKESVRGSSSRRSANRTRSALVMTEMALAVVLLVGAGLLIRSFVNLLRVDPGYRTENVVTFTVSVPDLKYQHDRDKNRFTDQLIASLRQLPGTQSVAAALSRPMQNIGMRASFDIDGRPPARNDSRLVAAIRPVTLDYFNALGIKLDRGRLFTQQENGWAVPPVVVVSESFVKKFFPAENPLGKHITLGITHDTAETNKSPAKSRGEIVGIVADVKQDNLKEAPYPAVYLPQGTFPESDMAFVIRSTASPAVLAPAIRDRVAALDRDMPIFDMQTMAAAVSASIAQPRFYTVLLGAFAALALLLAALGIYGVIAYTVNQRTRELGIRIALGATEQRVVRLVLGQGIVMTTAGIAVGAVGALWLVRLLGALLYGVTATDGVTFVAVAATLFVVAALASYLPARRAARVDPIIAMRTE